MFLFHSVSCGACGRKMNPSSFRIHMHEVGEVYYERVEYACQNMQCKYYTSVIISTKRPKERRGMVTIPKILSPYMAGRWARLVQWAKEMVK